MAELALKILNRDDRINESQTINDAALAVVISDRGSYEDAGQFLLSISQEQKRIKLLYKDIKASAKKTHSDICTQEKNHLGVIAPAERHLRQQISEYQMEQERIRIAAERKAKEKAEKEAEKERLRLLKQAEKLEEKGQTELAEERMEEAADVVAEPVAVAKTETARSDFGTVSARKDIEIILPEDAVKIRDFCRAVATAELPAGCITINKAAVKAFCKLQGIKPGPFHGVIVKEKFITMARGR
jgi:hypothetical protein